jgi:hypothetical protein
MFKLIFENGPFGDCTSNYTVNTDATCLANFIDEMLKERNNEWGEICIRSNNSFTDDICVCSYNNGKIERKASKYDIYGATKIKNISANGGWSNMSYDVKVEDFDALPKQNRGEFQMVYWGKKM